MEIQIHCPRCNKIERIEREKDNSSIKMPSPLNSIPLPNTKNGLDTYSIVHSDHTLIIDVDHNGDVRGEEIIDRIDQGIENTIAAISMKMLDSYILNNFQKEIRRVIYFITRNRMVHRLLLSVFQHMIYNIPRDSISLLQVKRDETICEFDNLTFYVGDWSDKIYNFQGDRFVAVYELNEHNANQVKLYIKKDYENNPEINTTILFEKNYVSTCDGKNTLNDIFRIISPQALDISNPIKAAKSLYSLLN